MLCRLAEHRGYVALLPKHITTLTALFLMIAHSVKKGKKMINLHNFYFPDMRGPSVVRQGKNSLFFVYCDAISALSHDTDKCI